MHARRSILSRVARGLLAILLGAVIWVRFGPSPVSAGPKQAATATFEQLLAQDLSEEQREGMIRVALARGKKHCRRLARSARAVFEETRDAYVERLREQTRHLLPASPAPEREAEIATLRKQARSVASAEEVSVAEIREVCDPAIIRLAELIVVPPPRVLESFPELAATREELSLLAEIAMRAAGECGEPPGAFPDSPEAVDALLRSDELFASLTALELTPHDLRVLKFNRKAGRKLDWRETEVVLMLNARRLLLDVGALAMDTRLVHAGRDHCRDMARLGFRGHESPVGARSDVVERAARWGTSASGENVAYGPERAEVVLDLWWYSPSHHRVMMGKHARIGVGRHDRYWTMVLGREDPSMHIPKEIRDTVDDPPPRTPVKTKPKKQASLSLLGATRCERQHS